MSNLRNCGAHNAEGKNAECNMWNDGDWLDYTSVIAHVCMHIFHCRPR